MKHVLFGLFLLVNTAIFAQQRSTFTISGQVVDSISNESLPYVTCAITPGNNTKQILTRFASDMHGNFKSYIKSQGTYTLIITSVGQSPIIRTFTIDASNPEINFGTLKMGVSKEALREVSVVASKPLIKAEADKITYDAEQDPESKSSTVLDLLRKVPMVTVDGQDNIQLNGSSSFKFYLNGKPTNMFNNNAGIILKSMPSNMVKSIEVITQPGAKYDAEGVGGIINIVTIQNAGTKGFAASGNAQASSRGSVGGGLNLSLQQGKFSFSGNYNYNIFRQMPVTTTTERINYVAGSRYDVGKQTATANNRIPMQFGSGQLTYELDTLNLVTFSYNRRFGRPENRINDATSIDYLNNTPIFSYTQNSIQKQSWGSTDFGVDYQRSFKTKGEQLTFSYKLSNTPNSSNYTATNLILLPTTPQPGLAHKTVSNNKAATNEHAFQVDYTKPLAKGQTLEVGTKYLRRLNASEITEQFDFFDFLQPVPFTPYISTDSTTSFNNNQNILGAYTSYTANIKKWSLKAGLRYEHTWLNATFDTNIQNFELDYPSLTPSATATYRITDMQSLKLGYNNRIQRPSISFLNPYIDRRDPKFITYGNPNLDPEKSHNVSMTFSSFASKYNLNAELSYLFVNNGIEQFSTLENGIQEITYGNIGKKNQLGLSVFGSYRGLKWLNLFTNASVNYVNLESKAIQSVNSGLTGRMFLGGTITLPKEFRFSFGGGGNLPQLSLQGSQSAFYFSYGALSKDFLKKKLNVSISGVYLPVSRIQITTEAKNTATGNLTFKQKTEVHLTSNTEFRLNMSYRIGNMNAQVKKVKKSINIDDQKQKENTNIGETPM